MFHIKICGLWKIPSSFFKKLEGLIVRLMEMLFRDLTLQNFIDFAFQGGNNKIY